MVHTPAVGGTGCPFTVHYPVTLRIHRHGTLRVRVTVDGETAHTALFAVVHPGDARSWRGQGSPP